MADDDKTYDFPIEAGHILMFARAVGDEDAAYVDPEGPQLAPPTFLQAAAQFNPQYPLRPKGHDTWFGSSSVPTGLMKPDDEAKSKSARAGVGVSAGTLHAEQRFEFFRYPKAGDRLKVSTRPGRKWERQSKRAGKLQFSESIVEYRDAETNELVATATNVGVVTERAVDH